MSARGPDNANGSNSWSRPNKERVEAPWTFSPSEAMANDEPDYGANDDYGGGDDHITDDWEPPSRGPRTPPHRGGDESPLHKPSNTGKKSLTQCAVGFDNLNKNSQVLSQFSNLKW